MTHEVIRPGRHNCSSNNLRQKSQGRCLISFFFFSPSSSVMFPSELPHVSPPLQQQQGFYRCGFVIFSKVMMDGKRTEKPDKATLHQSAIELRGSTVVSASRCLLVEVCPKPPGPYARIDGSFTSLHLCFPPPRIGPSPVRRHLFLSFSLVYSLLQSCVCPQTGTLLICTVLSLG